jgi:FtsP/CotA-like multicopper oxidase with cupredoxin domain/peroxiredoxin
MTDPEIESRRQRNKEAVLASTIPFVEPDTIKSNNGLFEAILTVGYADSLIGENRVFLRTYNGRLVGPTFRVKPGDVLDITLRNELPVEPLNHGGHNRLHGFNTTNLHTHGLHVSPKRRSDNVLVSVLPGEEFKYQIEIPENQPPGTFWYHAHRHGSVAAQVSSGMSGAIIVEGGLDHVPEIAVAKDRVFVFQQIPYVLEHGIGVIEERYAEKSFGPGTWDALGRHTTINGQLFPELTLDEGVIERWRLIHGGVREGMGLRLVGVDGNAKGKYIPLTQIAWDGLPLGKLLNTLDKSGYPIVELFPGYRADVLVQIPTGWDGTYLLEDAVITPAVTGFTQNPSFHPKYLAKVIVPATSNAADMKMPSPQALAAVRDKTSILQELKDNDVTGQQSATYSINEAGAGVEFVIDGHAYDEMLVRPLKLGAVDQWSLKSVNGVGPVDHPFHIHVNPFQVTEVKDPSGNSYPDMLGWRDTLLLRADWTYTVRMKYHEPFTGRFVQHCHILDHEDLGMMELVEIMAPEAYERYISIHGMASRNAGTASIPTGAVDWRLRTAEEQLHRLSSMNRPAVVILYQGGSCLHCIDQLQEFAKKAEAFKEAGVDLFAISPESSAVLKVAIDSYGEAGEYPITLLSDPGRRVFKLFGCDRPESTHGTFLLNDRRHVTWHNVSDGPFTNVDHILTEIARTKRSDKKKPE